MTAQSPYEAIWDRDCAQALDRWTQECGRLSESALIEAAGHAVAKEVLAREAGAPVVVVAVGSGNNGADGLVAARLLRQQGWKVEVHWVATSSEPTGGFREQAAIFKAFGGRIHTISATSHFPWDQKPPPPGAVLIDAILGLGFCPPMRESASPLIQCLRSLRARFGQESVYAVDIPSGLDANACVEPDLDMCVRAKVTITFERKKPVHTLAPHRDLCGEIIVAPISLWHGEPPYDGPQPFIFEPVEALLPQDPWKDLRRSAHKYQRGHVLVLGGSPGKVGAPVLTGLAALRTGAGWVTLSVPTAAAADRSYEVPPELTWEDLWTPDGQGLCSKRLEAFLGPKGRTPEAIVLGPGTVAQPIRSPEALEVLDTFVKKGGALVLDAAATQGALGFGSLGHGWTLLPHPGEWRRLESPSEEQQSLPARPRLRSDVELVARLAKGACLVFKDATPLVVQADSGSKTLRALALTGGTQALSRAGSGDVLAGILGALLAGNAARGRMNSHPGSEAPALHPAGSSAPWVALAYSKLCHAARHAAEARGPDGVLASDLLECLDLQARSRMNSF